MVVNRNEKVDELVSTLHKYLNQIKTEDYVIINNATRSLDDYQKDIYAQMHCVVAMYDTVLTDDQIKYMTLILQGMEIEDDIEKYIGTALKISEKEFREFVRFMKGSEVKYYFALESILINALGNPTQNTYDFLAELLQVMEVQYDDLNYIVQVAKAVIMQDDRLFYEAGKYMTPNTLSLDMSKYMKLINSDRTEKEVVISGKASGNAILPKTFSKKNVLISDLTINDNLYFEECGTVTFKDCEIIEKDLPLSFSECGNVYFENCVFNDWIGTVLRLKLYGYFSLEDCRFSNCREINASEENKNLIYNIPLNENKSWIKGCKFKDCQYHRITNAICIVEDCVFANCNIDSYLFEHGCESINNKLNTGERFYY